MTVGVKIFDFECFWKFVLPFLLAIPWYTITFVKKQAEENCFSYQTCTNLEPFIDYNWNLLNSEIVRVPAQRNKSVKLVMAGTPRIKRLAKLDIWASQVSFILN